LKVAEFLAGKFGQARVLYDEFHEADLARLNLDILLPELYRTESELVVVFLCAEYSQKRWCSLEWRYIRQLIATEHEGRIMLMSFDDINGIPELGILPGDGYVFIENRSAGQISELILERLRIDSGGKKHDSTPQFEKYPDWLSVPHYNWTGLPGALLRADLAVVPFHRRDEELKTWTSWAKGSGTYPVALIIGAGGMGKTRFARELCVTLRIERFVCGFVDPSDTDQCVNWLSARANLPSLLVIDYAETAVDQVAEILRVVARRRLTATRILLLARGAGDWWAQLKRKGAGVGDLLTGEPEGLEPLAMNIGQARESYELAVSAFADRFQVARPESAAEVFDSPEDKRALILHMKALLAVQNIKAKGIDPVLQAVLDREAEYWGKERANRQLPKFLEDGFERLAGIVSGYNGVRTKNEAVAVIGKIGFFRDQPQAVVESVANLFHDCYPGASWIEPIQPDLLKEYLVEKATREYPDDVRRIIFEINLQ